MLPAFAFSNTRSTGRQDALIPNSTRLFIYFLSSRITFITERTIIRITEIQKGDKTHTQDQLIILHNFSTIKTTPNKEPNPIFIHYSFVFFFLSKLSILSSKPLKAFRCSFNSSSVRGLPACLDLFSSSLTNKLLSTRQSFYPVAKTVPFS